MGIRTPTNPNGAGRKPIELDPAGIAELSGKGLSKQQIADYFGVHITTLLRRSNEDADIARAFAIGRSRANFMVANALYDRALRGDATAIIWYEKTRTGRTDRLDIRVTELVEAELQAFLDYLADNLDPTTYELIERLVSNYAKPSASSTPAAE